MTAHRPAWARRSFAAVSIAVLTAAFLWPALVTGAPWAFPDTASYYKGGAAAWAFALDAAGIADPGLADPDAAAAPVPDVGRDGPEVSAGPAPAPDAGAATEAEAGQALNVRYGIRSVPYSLAVYASVRFVSLWAPIVMMSAATAILVWMATRALAPPVRLAIGLGLAATTVLPFFGALFQPDILTAVVVLVPIIVMLHDDSLGWGALLALFAGMAFATLAHYGNLPLAGLALLWLGAWGLLRRRRRVVGLVAIPVAAAVVVNLAIALAIDAGPSLAPGRYPLLLARSIEDGPGHDYLTEACPEAEWTLCEVYGGEMPSNIGQFLWSEGGIRERATPEQLARIGAEEVPLLLAILRHDPGGQVGAFLRNAAEQFVLFGNAGSYPAGYVVTNATMETVATEADPRPAPPERVQLVVVLLGAAALIVATLRRRHPEALAVGAFLLASLVVYAAVCGGLSAPVPRYQARLIWIVPLIGVVLILHRRPGAGLSAPEGAARRA